MNTTLRQSSSSWKLEALGAGIDDPLDELSLAVVLVDHAGRIRWQNRTSLARVGNRNGVPVVDTVAPEYRHVFQTQFAQALLGDRVDEIEIVVVGLDGARRRSRVNTVAMRREGEVVGLLVVATPLNWDDRRPAAPCLPPRLHETLALLAAGRSTPEAADRLGVTLETARNYVRRLLRGLGAHSRLEAVAKGHRLGLIPRDPPGSSGR